MYYIKGSEKKEQNFHAVELSLSQIFSLKLISSIFDKCSMLEQTQSRPNHTTKTKVYFNEFVANVLRDNIGSTKISLQPQKEVRSFLVLNIKNLGSG